MTSGRDSICSMVSSHMLTWYAESSEPEKYSTVCGRYSRSQALTVPRTLSAFGGSRFARRCGTSASTYSPPSPRVTAIPTKPASSESVTAQTRRPTTAARSRWSIFTVARLSSRRGGASGMRSLEARSTFLVTTGIWRRLPISVTNAPCGACRPKNTVKHAIAA